MSFIRLGNYTLSNSCATASFTVLSGEMISGTASVQGCDCSFLNFTIQSTRFVTGMTIGTVTDSCGITYTGYLSYKNGHLTLIILDSCRRAQEYVLSFVPSNIQVLPPTIPVSCSNVTYRINPGNYTASFNGQIFSLNITPQGAVTNATFAGSPLLFVNGGNFGSTASVTCPGVINDCGFAGAGVPDTSINSVVPNLPFPPLVTTSLLVTFCFNLPFPPLPPSLIVPQ